jgi:hypothetical protein
MLLPAMLRLYKAENGEKKNNIQKKFFEGSPEARSGKTLLRLHLHLMKS